MAFWFQVSGGTEVTNSNYNGLEKTLKLKVLERERRWQLAEEKAVYGVNESFP